MRLNLLVAMRKDKKGEENFFGFKLLRNCYK